VPTDTLRIRRKSVIGSDQPTPNEASPQTAEAYGQGRGNRNRIDGGLRSSRQGRALVHESSKLSGLQDPWTTGAWNEEGHCEDGLIEMVRSL
jgi:hypothetical protein